MLGAAFSFSIMSALVKVASAHANPFQAVFVRSLVGTAIMAMFALQQQVSPLGSKSRHLITRSLLGFLAVCCFFFALSRIPIGTATLLNSTAPIFVVLLAPFVLKEAVPRRVFWLLPFFVLGVALLVKPEMAAGQALATLVALLSGGLSAGAYLSLRKLAESDRPLTVVFYFSAVSTVGSIPLMAFDWKPLPAATWLFLVLAGTAATAGQLAMTRAYGLEPASRVSLYGFMGPVFAFAVGILFFSEVPDLMGAIGALTVIVCGLLAARAAPRDRSAAVAALNPR